MSRREALRWLGLIGAGLAAGACTPLRIGLHAWPERFDTDGELDDRVLRAFVATVIPGVESNRPDLVRAYADPFYHFTPYRSFLASDLCRRGARLYGEARFDRLGPDERAAVLRDGLAADGTTRRLYTGAIFLAQVSTYASIYDDERGCPLIAFEGRYRVRPLDETTYPDPGRFLAVATTLDGNVA